MTVAGRRTIVGIAALVISSCLGLPLCAAAQSLQGRFFTAKSTYLIGEPVFVIFHFTNSSDRALWVDSQFGQPCFGKENITVVGAWRAVHEWKTALDCYGGWAGSCLGGMTELKAGQTHSERIFVNHYYKMDQPGLYEIRIARKVSTYLQGSYSHPGPTISVRADIDIRVVQGSEWELKAAFQPVLKDLKSTDGEQRWQAVQAVTELAHPFLQQTVIDISKNPTDVWAAIEGLYKLNTTKSRERLAEIVQAGESDTIRERAMRALAALGDEHYLPFYFRLAHSLKGHEQIVAIESAGLLGGSQAVPFISSFLSSQDPAVRMAAIRGLAGTTSRHALPRLIEEILDPDPGVRQIAGAALAQLTHLSTADNALASVHNPALTFQKWFDWWLSNGRNAPIYGPTECAEPQPLN